MQLIDLTDDTVVIDLTEDIAVNEMIACIHPCKVLGDHAQNDPLKKSDQMFLHPLGNCLHILHQVNAMALLSQVCDIVPLRQVNHVQHHLVSLLFPSLSSSFLPTNLSPRPPSTPTYPPDSNNWDLNPWQELLRRGTCRRPQHLEKNFFRAIISPGSKQDVHKLVVDCSFVAIDLR